MGRGREPCNRRTRAGTSQGQGHRDRATRPVTGRNSASGHVMNSHPGSNWSSPVVCLSDVDIVSSTGDTQCDQGVHQQTVADGIWGVGVQVLPIDGTPGCRGQHGRTDLHAETGHET